MTVSAQQVQVSSQIQKLDTDLGNKVRFSFQVIELMDDSESASTAGLHEVQVGKLPVTLPQVAAVPTFPMVLTPLDGLVPSFYPIFLRLIIFSCSLSPGHILLSRTE